MNAGRPLLFESPEALQERIDQYFESCHEEVWEQSADGQWHQLLDKEGLPMMRRVKPYTITGLAAYLGTTRRTLLDYEERDGFSHTIRAAKTKIEAFVEESLWQPKIATGVAFNLKNNFGWQDKSEVNMSGDLEIKVDIE
ncbi:hypothetical protein HMPREF3291_05270 [Bacillus sp. HMSC76G11]|nr:hypothetical protein HMPREF3291_05270 [Bacillus sp. HMSC76G11]